jgi:hypothetical protein
MRIMLIPLLVLMLLVASTVLFAKPIPVRKYRPSYQCKNIGKPKIKPRKFFRPEVYHRALLATPKVSYPRLRNS